MRTAAELLERIRGAGELGLSVSPGSHVNMQVLKNRTEGVVRNQREGIVKLLKQHRVRYIQGEAHVDRPHLILLNQKEGGTLEISWDKLILALGSRPLEIPALPFDGQGVISSNDVFSLTHVPSSMVIVGGGAIGCEFAFMFRAFGADVTVVEATSRILPLDSVDEEISKTVQREMKKRKIRFLVNRMVERAEAQKGTIQLTLKPSPGAPDTTKEDSGPRQLETDMVLVCVGRESAAAHSGLDRLRVKTDERGWILANERMETSVPGVYAVGDALGPSRPMLAHVATTEGSVAAENALGKGCSMNYEAVPGAIFTLPEVAHVGLTETQAGQQGYQVRADKALYRNLGKAQAMGEIAGEAKVVWDGDSGRILGVHLVGPHAADLIAEGTLALRTGCTVSDLAETIHAHPTLAEIMLEVSLRAAGRPLHG